MAVALAYEDAKKNQRRLKADGVGTVGETLFTNFFGAPDLADSPHAGLSQRQAGRASRAHFHTVDQFQVVVGGRGKIGRHDLAAYSVHFSRAYTPYGPLVTTGSDGLTFFFLRTRPDPGPQRLPESKPALRAVSHRDPWQITSAIEFSDVPAEMTSGAVFSPVSGIKDDHGLAVCSVSMMPNAVARAPDPGGSEGQYLVLTKGSLWHDGKEHQGLALVFVRPDEGPYEIKAGAVGLEAIVLNFPRSHGLRARDPLAQSAFKAWQCGLCAFTYNEAAGLPDEGIAPGTLWKDVPENWSCPDCSASKTDFQMIAG